MADAQGLSYYGEATITQRLHLSIGEPDAARRQLIDLDLIAHRAPLYQVLALPGTTAAARTTASAPAPAVHDNAGPVSLALLLQQMESRRRGGL
ncbi:MAG TPA: hypothetical protein VFP68_10045 [Burkholderiaceae bacterium]|nr:hypothetical protein [Burkholderiaceae bacterium]